METGWQYRLLGPLTVSHNGRPVEVKAAKQRVLLASLLLEANQAVSTTRLVGCLWGDAPPRGCRNTLQNHVLRLRRVLLRADADMPVRSSSDGYLIQVHAGALDLHSFQEALAGARTATRTGDSGRAAQLLHEALSLWQGHPLSDVPSDVLHHEVVPALVEHRMRAVELRIGADLALGLHHDLLPELLQLTAQHPLRESLWALRMVALHRSGRQAEALACFRAVRDMLSEELGVGPCPELISLHQRMLGADSALVTVK